jgi:adenylate kinase family enzyme
VVGVNFPVIGTKVSGLSKKFDINSFEGRKPYFAAKVGNEIERLKKYFEAHTFMAILLGKKNAGKGTYTKILMEIFGSDKMVHVAVGDLVRDFHDGKIPARDLRKYYRGFVSFDDAVEGLTGSNTKKLAPTEAILALLKNEISKYKNKILFIDGLPREMDQVSYSLYFRDLINFRDDPDMFMMIDIPEVVIDERIKYRRICPICHTPRNLKLLTTSVVEYDSKKKEFYFRCDNPACGKPVMVPKEGDDLGIEPIRGRLNKDEEIIKLIMNLHGVPKVFLRNSIPVDEAKEKFDDYEITPAYSYELDKASGKVKIIESPWIFKDDNGVKSYSLLPAPVVVSMIKQLVEVLGV